MLICQPFPVRSGRSARGCSTRIECPICRNSCPLHPLPSLPLMRRYRSRSLRPPSPSAPSGFSFNWPYIRSPFFVLAERDRDPDVFFHRLSAAAILKDRDLLRLFLVRHHRQSLPPHSGKHGRSHRGTHFRLISTKSSTSSIHSYFGVRCSAGSIDCLGAARLSGEECKWVNRCRSG